MSKQWKQIMPKELNNYWKSSSKPYSKQNTKANYNWNRKCCKLWSRGRQLTSKLDFKNYAKSKHWKISCSFSRSFKSSRDKLSMNLKCSRFWTNNKRWSIKDKLSRKIRCCNRSKNKHKWNFSSWVGKARPWPLNSKNHHMHQSIHYCVPSSKKTTNCFRRGSYKFKVRMKKSYLKFNNEFKSSHLNSPNHSKVIITLNNHSSSMMNRSFPLTHSSKTHSGLSTW